MRRNSVTVLAMVILMIASTSAFAQDWFIVPGRSVGWVRIGMDWPTVQKQFGSNFEMRPGNNVGYNYRDYGLVFYVDRSNRISEIVVIKVGYQGVVYRTAGGVHVGTPMDDTTRMLGAPKEDHGYSMKVWPGLVISGNVNTGVSEAIHVVSGGY